MQEITEPPIMHAGNADVERRGMAEAELHQSKKQHGQKEDADFIDANKFAVDDSDDQGGTPKSEDAPTSGQIEPETHSQSTIEPSGASRLMGSQDFSAFENEANTAE